VILASELIKVLQDMIKEHGDLECIDARSRDTSVEFYEDSDGSWFVIS
jgi:hypothetical protein